jgi:hypothetical protein
MVSLTGLPRLLKEKTSLDGCLFELFGLLWSRWLLQQQPTESPDWSVIPASNDVCDKVSTAYCFAPTTLSAFAAIMAFTRSHPNPPTINIAFTRARLHFITVKMPASVATASRRWG